MPQVGCNELKHNQTIISSCQQYACAKSPSNHWGNIKTQIQNIQQLFGLMYRPDQTSCRLTLVIDATGATPQANSSSQLRPLSQLAAQQPHVLNDVISQPAI